MAGMNGLYVTAERLVASRAINLYILSPDGRHRLTKLGDGELDGGEWVEITPGERVEPTIVLSDYLAEGIAKALVDTIPPSASMQRHLDDAVKVRDVLLDLVAKVVRDGA